MEMEQKEITHLMWAVGTETCKESYMSPPRSAVLSRSTSEGIRDRGSGGGEYHNMATGFIILTLSRQ